MPRVSKGLEESRTEIMQACIAMFNEKGLKFTMDDVAKSCHMSKKTLYLIFSDKEELFLAMVDYLFDGIKESEKLVVQNTSLTTLEKIRTILGVMPEGYKEIDFGQLYSLKDKYPTIYRKVEERLETGWDTTIALIEQGIKEGVVKNVPIPIIKMMLEASLEQFFQRDILVRCGLTYAESLNLVVNVIVDGIKA